MLLKREILLEQPHYLILVDAKYSNQFSGKAYVAQEQIELVLNTPVSI